MRILILEPNQLFGLGVKHFLAASLGNVEVDYSDCSREARARLSTTGYSLLILEIGVERDNGIGLIKRVRSEHPELPMLVLSDYPIYYYGPRAIRAGACGFIGKDTEPEELLRAIRCVLEGRHYISIELADQLARGLRSSAGSDAPHEALSPRELQILRRLAFGQSLTHIARALGLSVKTVDTHKTHVLRKMGMKRREELARYAFAHGLIPSRRLGEKARADPTDSRD